MEGPIWKHMVAFINVQEVYNTGDEGVTAVVGLLGGISTGGWWW